MTHLLSIDVEASGQGLRTNFMTRIGAAYIDPDGKVLGTFSEYLAQPEGTCWEPRCVDEFWSKFPDLYEETKIKVAAAAPAKEVMKRFKEWVQEISKDKKSIIVFDTAGFDQAWIDYNLEDTSCLYILGYYESPLDISSYMMGVAKEKYDGSSKKSFEKATGVKFPKWNVSHDHNPANDATVTGLNAWFVRSLLRAD